MNIPADSFLRGTPVAHRGYHCKGIPENSMAAFERAVSFGYAIETDVHLTKDGQIVVFHDDDLARMTGESGLVRDRTAAELTQRTLAARRSASPSFPNSSAR